MGHFKIFIISRCLILLKDSSIANNASNPLSFSITSSFNLVKFLAISSNSKICHSDLIANREFLDFWILQNVCQFQLSPRTSYPEFLFLATFETLHNENERHRATPSLVILIDRTHRIIETLLDRWRLVKLCMLGVSRKMLSCPEQRTLLLITRCFKLGQLTKIVSLYLAQDKMHFSKRSSLKILRGRQWAVQTFLILVILNFDPAHYCNPK